MSKQLLTIRRACALYGLDARPVRRAIRRGCLPAFSAGGSRWRVTEDDFQKWIESTQFREVDRGETDRATSMKKERPRCSK